MFVSEMTGWRNVLAPEFSSSFYINSWCILVGGGEEVNVFDRKTCIVESCTTHGQVSLP